MKLRTIALSLLGLVVALTALNAQDRHPPYLRARADMRRAQSLLRVQEEPNVARRLIEADHEMEMAIHEVDRAAALDGRNIDDHPPVDTNVDRRSRFHKIVELLRGARADLGNKEDNPVSSDIRNLAVRHIDLAIERVRQAAIDLHLDRELGF